MDGHGDGGGDDGDGDGDRRSTHYRRDVDDRFRAVLERADRQRRDAVWALVGHIPTAMLLAGLIWQGRGVVDDVETNTVAIAELRAVVAQMTASERRMDGEFREHDYKLQRVEEHVMELGARQERLVEALERWGWYDPRGDGGPPREPGVP